MRKLFTLGLLGLLLPLSLYAEKSAFGAGDLDSPNPYGLTKAEKKILDNKQTIGNIKGTSSKNRSRIGNVEESVSGMQSIVEGLNENVRKNTIQLQELKTQIVGIQETSGTMNTRLDEIVLTHEEHISQLKVVMGELSTLIDTINTHYVSKEEYNKLANEINSFKLEVSKQLRKIASSGNSVYDNKSSANVANDAYAFFKAKKYADAIDAYEHLIKKKYKPARAHYYIGESYFLLDEYTNAVAYFKESAKLYSKADYMPNLMFHTAISLKKTGDDEGADQFFEALVVKYPSSSQARKSEKFLN
ncbi:tetratricopeptide repeat protein [Sulfurimonas sp. MAG313]|nr:tetratricopeptide repeat protein [Sulfurimonas sp. MAG313]MDF1881541.1 tetratricopeptide repeat protein [Sulfurimonas sp. MAG313]